MNTENISSTVEANTNYESTSTIDVMEKVKEFCQIQDFDTAVSFWKEHGNIETLEVDDLTYLGGLFNKVREHDQAFDLFNTALSKSPKEIFVLVNLLYTLIYLNKEDEAIKIGSEFESNVEVNNEDFHVIMGRLTYFKETFTESERHFSLALDISADKDRSFVSGRIIDEILKSKSEFKAEYSPKYAFYEKIAFRLFSEAEYELALEYLQPLYEYSTDNIDLIQKYILALLKSNKLKEGLNILGKYENSLSHEFFVDLGKLYLSKFNLPEPALQCFTSGFKKNNSDSKSVTGMISSLVKLERFTDAIEFYKSWVKEHTPDFIIIDEMLNVYVNSNDFDKAYNCLEEIIEGSNTPSPMFVLSYVERLKKKNEIKDIIKLANLYKLNPKVEIPLLCCSIIGDCYHDENDFKLALEYYWFNPKKQYGFDYYLKEILTQKQIENIYNIFYELSLNNDEDEFKELLQKHRFSRTKNLKL